jgi:hypothetical protein
MNRTLRDTFPTSAVYLPAAGGSHLITGILDESAKVFDQANPGVPMTECLFTIRLADLPVAPHAYDRLTIGVVTYKVSDVPRPDGSGMVALPLEVV